MITEKECKIALTACIEVVLMRRGNAHYHLVLAKLQTYYNCGILECLDHPEYLQKVLKEVYHKDYNSVLDDIGAEAEQLEGMNEFKIHFFKIMKS
jgi:hypothetical protein